MEGNEPMSNNTTSSIAAHPSGSNAQKPKRFRLSEYNTFLGALRNLKQALQNQGHWQLTVTQDVYNSIKANRIHIPALTASIYTFSGSYCEWAGITLQVSGSVSGSTVSV